MDKYEYKVRSEEISDLIDNGKYVEAVSIADTIDWRRVRSVTMLLKIAALYRVNRRNEDSREMLLLAYENYPTNRSVVYSLCELSIELDDVVAAIEYYKQFVKLAPKDNGVYTLRYRILTAQEASLEERIEILEELKRKDYQEEWAYELAYLYHRVGLTTKCVEECDDIILWFGEGPYVMKAMELKALHVPLTEIQQAKYDSMLSHAEEDYIEEDYGDDYIEETDGQESYIGEYDSGDCHAENADARDYGEEGSDIEESGTNAEYAQEAYEDGEYPQEDYGAYAQEEYAEEAYENGEYAQEEYAEEAYENGEYPQEDYAEEAYGNNDYFQNVYVDDGYGNLSYIQDSYQDNDDTGGFYVEQAYDENGSPMETEGYTDQNGADVDFAADNYTEENDSDDGYGYPDNDYAAGMYGNEADDALNYNNGEYAQESPAAPLNNAADMSQYNTINLQKVVAESMKELFPDDEVFEEERERFSIEGDDIKEDTAEGDTGNVTGDTIVYTNLSAGKDAVQEPDSAGMADNSVEAADEISDITEIRYPDAGSGKYREEPDETGDLAAVKESAAPEPPAQADRVARMVTGVSEAAPEPHTGAVSRVIVPGDDARFIRADTDMDELRNTTEETVSEEHDRMESNHENVYHGQDLTDVNEETADEVLQKQPTGSMNLNDVLEEWERMKLDNAKKHQEEIKQHVLTQTGKILANFDNSIKSGILGELEREEAKAKGDGSPKDGPHIPRTRPDPKSDDDFDVEYVSEAEPDPKKEYLSELERVVTQELGGSAQNTQETYAGNDGYYGEDEYAGEPDISESHNHEAHRRKSAAPERYDRERYAEKGKELDPEEEESIAEMAKEDALRTQEIKMSTADLSSLSEKIVAATKKEAKGAKREEIRDFTPDEQTLFENFAVTKKIKKQIIYALENITLAAYTGNVIITGDAGLDAVRMAKNLIKEYHAADAEFSGRVAKITGQKINQRNLKDVFEKLNNGGIIIEKANGMSEEKLYEMASLLNRENLGIIVIMEDTKKEITKLLEKQAMIADYFNIRIDLMEMDINALVAYAKNYALALEYSIDELGTLALYTRIANMQSGNHVVTKDEVRDIIDEAIWKSKKSKIKNFVDVLFARRYDGEDMIVLKERDFM